MKTNHQCIVEIVRILARPYTMLQFPIPLRGELWDGIRLEDDSYEIWKTESVPLRVKVNYPEIDELEHILTPSLLTEDEEEWIKNLLQEILINY